MKKSQLTLKEYLQVQKHYADMKLRHQRLMQRGNFNHKLWCENLIQQAEQNLARIELRRA